jgi:four helix bundle protein
LKESNWRELKGNKINSKFQIQNSKIRARIIIQKRLINLKNHIPNSKMENKKYDLEERTLKYATVCIDLCRLLKRDIVNVELIRQLIRASGSVGANYREANNATTKKEFYYRIGISRREAKESKFWLELLLYANQNNIKNIEPIKNESLQLARIFSTIVKNNPEKNN